MTKWGKIMLIASLLWQIPVWAWCLYFQTPNTGLLLGFPTMVTVFLIMWAFYALFFGVYLTRKYLGDPTGNGIPIEELRKEMGKEVSDGR